MGLYDLYERLRHPGRQDDHGFDRRQWFMQIRHWVRRAGWKVLASDGTVHQFPVLPGRSPLRWQALESHRGIRKLLGPIALTYFVMGGKPRRNLEVLFYELNYASKVHSRSAGHAGRLSSFDFSGHAKIPCWISTDSDYNSLVVSL
jgi:hypothetical protein